MNNIRRIAALLTVAVALFSQQTITSGKKTVTTSGTPVTLAASSTLATWVSVEALPTNTGTICVGGSAVLYSSKIGHCITAGQAVPFFAAQNVAYDLSTIWIDAQTNGEGVSYNYAR